MHWSLHRVVVPLGQFSTQSNFMSEESLPQKAANEQPSPKPADQSAAQSAKEANKSSKQKTDHADSKPAEISEANSEQRPPIKRNVRGAKKAAAKKAKK